MKSALKNIKLKFRIFLILIFFAVVPGLVMFFVTIGKTDKFAMENLKMHLERSKNMTESGIELIWSNGNVFGIKLVEQDGIQKGILREDISAEQIQENIYDEVRRNVSEKENMYHGHIITKDKKQFRINEDTIPFPENISTKNDEGISYSYEGLVTDKEDRSYIVLRQSFFSFRKSRYFGDLFLYVSEEEISRAYENIVSDRDAIGVITSSDGTVISSNKKDTVGKEMTFVKDIILSGSKISFVTIDGKEYIYSSEKLRFTNGNMPDDWYLSLLIPRTVYFNKIEKFKSITLWLMAATTLFLALLSYYFARKFTVPLSNMEKNILKFGSGDLDVTLSINEDDDEIGHLKKIVEAMFCHIKALMQENEKKQQAQHMAEFKALQAQINPHFIYNTLDSISWMAKMRGQKDIEDIVYALSKFFKISLHTDEKYIMVEEEIDLIKSYITIQEIRYPNKFHVEFNIDEDIVDCEIIKIILQPFVENAFKHAFVKKDVDCLITINGYKDGAFIIFEIIDNGDGFDLNILKEEEKMNVGIKNTVKRIKYEYGEECGADFKSEIGEGTKVTLKLRCYEEIY